MEDNFFSLTNCENCGDRLKARIMSWFTDKTICMKCSEDEKILKSKLPDGGRYYEGCGYVPSIEEGN